MSVDKTQNGYLFVPVIGFSIRKMLNVAFSCVNEYEKQHDDGHVIKTE